jgi:hypothetical protein
VERVSGKLGLALNKQSFAGHSLRRGGATSLALRGVPDHLIKVLGRWRSDCYQRYLETPLSSIKEALAKMAAVPASRLQADLGVSAKKSPDCCACWLDD